MSKSEFLGGCRERPENVPGRHRQRRMRLVDIQLPLVEFEGVDSTCVDDFDRHRRAGCDHPSDIVVDLVLAGSRCDHAQEHTIVSQYHVSSGIQPRRIAHLHVRLPRIGRQHRWFKTGRIAHLQVTPAGLPGPRHRSAQRPKPRLFPNTFRGPLGPEQASQVDLATADMRVDVDPP